MAELVNMLRDLFQSETNDGTFYGIVVAIIVVLLSLAVFIIRRSGRSKRQGILLLGICEAGKTLIYLQLLYKDFMTTYTSIDVNSGEFSLNETKKKVRIIDLPGNDRLRGQFLEEYKGTARGIVFVINSATLQREIKEVAEFLYTILSDRVISSNSPPVLILCNKQDLTSSKSAALIRSQLEKEMTTLRITRSAALKGVGDTANNNAFLGKRDKDFDFSDLKPIKVEFAECSAQGKNKEDLPDLQQLYAWLNKVA
ncbi:signal recognition particle receptor subunit beta [Biomphalaria glabrata]|nr:signal recognition particle receptor subunit beta [Biomphalaria glabrata]